MKNCFLLLLALFIVATSCKDKVVKEPKHLIEKEKMIDIIYDLAILEASRTQNMGVQYNYPKTGDFLKSKYKIDSLTFAQNIKYYASDMKSYKRMYNKVKKRLDKEGIAINGGKPLVPDPEESVVK